MNSLNSTTILSRIHYRSTIYFAIQPSFANPLSFANSIWSHFSFHEFIMNSISIPRIRYQFAFFREFSMNSFSVASIHDPSREYVMNSISVSHITMDTVFFVNSLRIYFTLYTIDQTARNGPFWTILAHFWTLVTFYDIIWPQIILNLNSRPNSESKHMYIWYISISRPDSTPIGQVWPGLAGRTSSAF